MRFGVLILPKKKALEAFALQALALKLTGATDSFGLLTGPLFRRLFVGATQLHFTEDAFPLHFLLQDLQGLIDVVVANGDLHGKTSSLSMLNSFAMRYHANRI